MTASDPTMACSDCGRVMSANLLDAVLLDPDGNDASAEAYCRQCWPRHRVVDGDRWRENGQSAWWWRLWWWITP
jgi:hypothetical protein